MKRKLKFIDLFAGGGGFSYGFKTFTPDGTSLPFEFAGAIEYDPGAAATLVSALVRQGIEREKAQKLVVCGDITHEETKNKLYDICSEVDVIIGGPPCQSFSLIGPRSGDKEKKNKFNNDSRDNLFEHYIEIVKHYMPKFVVMENVKGILSKKDASGTLIINKIINSLEVLGYNLDLENGKKHLVLNAADYGVPQFRERVFLIANRIGKLTPIPQPTHSSSDPDKLPFVSLYDAIGDLPPLQAKITYTSWDKGKSHKNNPEHRYRIDRENEARHNGEDPMLFDYERYSEHYNSGGTARKKFLDYITQNRPKLITGHIARPHQETDILLFKGMEPGTSSKDLLLTQSPLLKYIKYNMGSFFDKYKKLAWNQPCSTVFAHLQKDGNRFIHPASSQARTLTVREAARIQSFPDDYDFEADGHVRYKFIGNAVPPLLAKELARVVYYSNLSES